MTQRGFLTVSVDDGHPADLHAAELFDELGLEATFYVPAANGTKPVIPHDEIRALATRFEVGAHTLQHVVLTRVPVAVAREEIRSSKEWLEQITGATVRSFCYPKGKFDAAVVALVADAGFAGARTVKQHLVDRSQNSFLWGVTSHARAHSRTVHVRHAVVERNWAGLANFARVFRGAVDWERHFLLGVEHVSRHGGVAHLFLHGWEVDARDEWSKLRRVLRVAVSEFDLQRLTNGDLFEQMNGRSLQMGSFT
jgi:hypothetical protein